MGYFNIFYKITRIIDFITKKRNRKAIMVIVIIIAAIVLWTNTSRAAQEDSTYTTDTNYFMLEEYNKLLDSFKISFDKYYTNVNFKERYDAIFQDILNGNFPYFYLPQGSYNTRIYTYNRQTYKTIVNTSLVYNDYMRVPSTAYNFTWYSGNRFYAMDMNITNNPYLIFETSLSSDANFSVPMILLYKIPSQIYDCMILARLHISK